MRLKNFSAIASLFVISFVCVSGCKTSGPLPDQGSEVKAVFKETATGAEIVYDLSECVAKSLIPSIDGIFNQALDEVGREIDGKIQDSSLRGSATSSLDVVKAKINFSGVTDNAKTFLEQEKASIYGITGFRLTTLIPNAFIVGFYHPVLDALPVDKIMKPITTTLGISSNYFPFVGVVVVPTCYQTLKADGTRSAVQTRFRIGAIGNLMWQLGLAANQAPAANAAETPAAMNTPPPGAAAPSTSSPWRVVLGFAWGSLYEPEQLSGPVFGFGIARARAAAASTAAEPSSGTGQVVAGADGGSYGLVFRPMVVIGSTDPKKTNAGFLDSTFETLKNITKGELSALKPSHLMLLVDIYGSATRKSYTNVYGGFNVISASVIDKFFERPIIVDREGKTQANNKGE